MSLQINSFIGDSPTRDIPLVGDVGNDLTPFAPDGSWTLLLTAKRQLTAPDTEAEFQLLTGAGITVSGAVASCLLAVEATAALVPANLYFDIRATHSDGTSHIVASGRWRLLRPATRLTTPSMTVYTVQPFPGYVGGDGAGITDAGGFLDNLGFTAAGKAIAAVGNATAGYFLKTLGDGTVEWAEVTGGAAPARLIQTGSFAAAAGGRYTLHNSGAVASITDPSGTAGASYTVIVGLGTTRFNAAGTTYGPSRVELVRYHNGSGWTTLAPTLADTLTVGPTAGTWDGGTFSNPQAFSSQTRPTTAGTGTPGATSLISLADLDSQLSLRVPDSLYLHDRFATGGSSSGTIGELGWILSGTGAGYNRAGPYGLLTPSNTITSALNCAVLGFFAGDYTGSLGIYSRSPVRTFNMIARVSQHYGWTSGKPSSWSMYFAADPTGNNNPNRIIPNNAVGISAIDPADATWAASTVYSVGNTLAPTTPNGYKYICTTAGTSAGTEPTWPTTFAGTVTNGGAVFTQAGRDGSANFIFFVTGADALSNITVAASSVAILTSPSSSTWFDLSIQATETGYSFGVNGETPVTIADTATLLGSPGFAVRNDTSQASVGMLRLRNFGFFGATRNY